MPSTCHIQVKCFLELFPRYYPPLVLAKSNVSIFQRLPVFPGEGHIFFAFGSSQNNLSPGVTLSKSTPSCFNLPFWIFSVPVYSSCGLIFKNTSISYLGRLSNMCFARALKLNWLPVTPSERSLNSKRPRWSLPLNWKSALRYSSARPGSPGNSSRLSRFHLRYSEPVSRAWGYTSA